MLIIIILHVRVLATNILKCQRATNVMGGMAISYRGPEAVTSHLGTDVCIHVQYLQWLYICVSPEQTISEWFNERHWSCLGRDSNLFLGQCSTNQITTSRSSRISLYKH